MNGRTSREMVQPMDGLSLYNETVGSALCPDHNRPDALGTHGGIGGFKRSQADYSGIGTA